jgi:hypothetical protein
MSAEDCRNILLPYLHKNASVVCGADATRGKIAKQTSTPINKLGVYSGPPDVRSTAAQKLRVVESLS